LYYFTRSFFSTGYLPAGRQGISDFGSEGCRFPACRQTGNPAAVTLLLETLFCFKEFFIKYILKLKVFIPKLQLHHSFLT
jgi:hypothetical protein